MILLLLIACVICTGLISGTALGEDLKEVPLYGLYETVLDYAELTGKPHPYSDPFYGVDLNVRFRGPTGKVVRWWGFYDGDGKGGQHGNIWKIRFMPDEPGQWKYSWHFSEGGGKGSGTFTAVDNEVIPAKPGPLGHDDHIRQWLVTADGSRHVFLNMFQDARLPSVWLKPREHIDALKDNGFDVLMIDGAVSARNDAMDESNPFHWMDTQHYVPRLQGWHLQESGLFRKLYEQQVYLFDWAGFYAGNGWIQLHNKPLSFQNKVIRYVLSRTAPYYFYLYNIGFELPEYVSVPSWPVERARYIKDINPWDHLITGHEVHGWSYARSPVIDFSALQNDGADIKQRIKGFLKNIIKHSWEDRRSLRGVSFHDIALAVWNSPSSPHPHCNECIWNAEWQKAGTEASHRRDLWSGITGGMSYAFYIKDSSVGLEAFRHANAFLKSGVKWWTMSPHDEAAVSGTAYVLANTGEEYIAYSASGRDIILSLPAGHYQWRWFNPSNGRYGEISIVDHQSGNAVFNKPDRNDWVLHIEKAN